MSTRISSPGLSIFISASEHDSYAQDVLDLVTARNKNKWARTVTASLLVAFGHGRPTTGGGNDE